MGYKRVEADFKILILITQIEIIEWKQWFIKLLFGQLRMQNNFHIPMQDLMAIEVQVNNKAAFEELVKAFQYDESYACSINLRTLAQKVACFLKIEGRVKYSLFDHFVQKNIPIEVNFKPLKPEQLRNMIEQWLSMHTESSTIIEKLYSNNHRNILFKRVLFQEKQTINDYFKTLSDGSMLRGVDLYQLLVDILSPFHLYEYNIDSESFFEKVNSMNSFLEIVNKFIHYEKRISVGISPKDIEYVRRFEFERLIEFWEELNPELTLLSERRKNMLEKGCQTSERSYAHREIQTQKITLSLNEIINDSLTNLNKITSDNNEVQDLEAIDRIYSFLRKQKIALLQRRSPPSALKAEAEDINISKRTEKRSYKSPDSSPLLHKHRKEAELIVNFIDSINHQISDTVHFQPTEAIQSSISVEHSSKKSTDALSQIKLSDTIKSIYNIYFSVNFGAAELSRCLKEMGVPEGQSRKSIDRVIEGKLRLGYITYQHFERVIRDVMVSDRELTKQVLEQFLKMKLDALSTRKSAAGRYMNYFGSSYERLYRY